jgi:hypothetical protein
MGARSWQKWKSVLYHWQSPDRARPWQASNEERTNGVPHFVTRLIADWRKRGERITELEPYESLGEAPKIMSENGMGRFS